MKRGKSSACYFEKWLQSCVLPALYSTQQRDIGRLAAANAA